MDFIMTFSQKHLTNFDQIYLPIILFCIPTILSLVLFLSSNSTSSTFMYFLI
jgi:hypothetical protein